MKTEKCTCDTDYPIVLQCQLTNHALVCSNCNLDKEIEGLTSDLVSKIKIWDEEYNKVYRIWLENKNEISDFFNKESNLNKTGIKIIEKLNSLTTTYYWWQINEGEQFHECPYCNGELTLVENNY